MQQLLTMQQLMTMTTTNYLDNATTVDYANDNATTINNLDNATTVDYNVADTTVDDDLVNVNHKSIDEFLKANDLAESIISNNIMENFIEDLTDKKLEQLEEIRDFQFKRLHTPFVPLKVKIPKTKIFLHPRIPI